jgi:hypothetical protein
MWPKMMKLDVMKNTNICRQTRPQVKIVEGSEFDPLSGLCTNYSAYELKPSPVSVIK